tara:strand:+ start:696 stop:1124 length:429 start_codon:yes stop_codon:yes gene_type:complete
MPETIFGQIGAVFMIAGCAFALLKGDEPERIAGSVFALAWFATLLVQGDGDLYHVQWGIFYLDLVMLAVFVGLTWKSRRAWPVWACAFQLLAVMGHIMNMTDLRPPIASFYTVINLAAYGVIISLAVGTFWAWQERRAAGLE